MTQPNFIAAYIVDRSTGSEPTYLLLRRSQKSYLSGIWQIVTGKLESGESACSGVQREIREETSLKPSEIYNVDVTMFYEQTKNRIAYSANFCAFANKNEPVILSEEEHDLYQWCSFSEAATLLAFPSQKTTLEFIHQHFVLQNSNPVNRLQTCTQYRY